MLKWIILKYPERESLLNNVMRWGNSRKSYAGRLSGLNNEYIMKKKRSFQSELINRINNSADLNSRYGNVWKDIEGIINKLKSYAAHSQILRFHNYLKPEYYRIAQSVLKIARQKDLPNNERDEQYKDENFKKTIEEIYPDEMEIELQNKLLHASITFLNGILEANDPILTDFLENKNGDEAIEYIRKN